MQSDQNVDVGHGFIISLIKRLACIGWKSYTISFETGDGVENRKLSGMRFFITLLTLLNAKKP